MGELGYWTGGLRVELRHVEIVNGVCKMYEYKYEK